MAVYKEKTGSVVGFAGTKMITNEALLELPVDVLVPAALESVITEQNAKNIKAKIIVEMANGPVTPGADDLLSGKQITFVPDVLANSGGVAVSSFEWEQNRKGVKWSEEKVNQKLEKIMKAALEEIWQIGKEHRVDLRQGAYIAALKKISSVYKKEV